VVFSALFRRLQFPDQIEELQIQFHDLSMRHWFLSYNSQDLALMQGLEAALRRKDPEANIYFAPRTMRAGGFYLPELERRSTKLPRSCCWSARTGSARGR
jgi:hypothetical protein